MKAGFHAQKGKTPVISYFIFIHMIFFYFWLLEIIRVHCFFEGHPFKLEIY